MRRVAYKVSFFFVVCLAGVPVARADQAGSIAPDAGAEQVGAEKAGTVSAPTPAPVAAAKPIAVEPRGKATRLPVYIADWGRLAELTQSDRLVFPQADFWADRQEHVRWILGGGLFVGVGVAIAGTISRVATDHWTDTAERSVAAGVSVAALTLIAAWWLSPDHDDLLTVINQWNFRHPDRPLAP